MKRGLVIGVGVGVGVLAAVCIAWFMHGAWRHEAPPPAQAAAPVPAVISQPAPVGASPANAPDADGPWRPSHTVARDLEAARAGDAPAMMRLGRALRHCRAHVADPEAKAIQRERDERLVAMAERDAQKRPAGREFWDRHHANNLARHADCLALGKTLVDSGLQWLELAARAGETGAMVSYAEEAFADYAGPTDLLANLDEVARRRDLARTWAMQALEAGEPAAIDVIQGAYLGQSPLFPRDLQAAAPYSMAANMLHQRRRDPAEFQRLYDDGPAREEYAWGGEWTDDPAQWQATLDRAREIVDFMPPDGR